MLNRFFFLLFSFFFLACQKEFKNKDELINYINVVENNYLYTEKRGSYEFKLQYKPTDLIIAQHLREPIGYTKVESLRAHYSQFSYFTLSISKDKSEILKGKSKTQGHGNMINQLSFLMNEKIYIITKDKDTMQMIDFVYPRMYGFTEATTILMAFPEKDRLKSSGTFDFVIEEIGLSTGKLKFNISSQFLIKEPIINFENYE